VDEKRHFFRVGLDEKGAIMRLRAGIVIALAAALGCSTLQTSVDYDRSASFSRYKTFAFAPGTPARRSLTQNRIEKVIGSTLQSKGLALVALEVPDLRVFTHVIVERQQRIETIVWGYGWRWGGGIAASTITDLPIGTLIVDLVDTETKTIVWRGEATDALDSSSEARQRQLQVAVAKMFEDFPVRPGGSQR
jgi:hypothetical protein